MRSWPPTGFGQRPLAVTPFGLNPPTNECTCKVGWHGQPLHNGELCADHTPFQDHPDYPHDRHTRPTNPHHPEQVYFCTRRGQVFGTHDSGTIWHEGRLPESVGNVISVATVLFVKGVFVCYAL